jgi:excisionase family DNA binding protein
VWHSIASSATYTGVSTRTIRRHIASGALPAFRYGRRLIRIDQADLDALFRRIPTAAGK